MQVNNFKPNLHEPDPNKTFLESAARRERAETLSLKFLRLTWRILANSKTRLILILALISLAAQCNAPPTPPLPSPPTDPAIHVALLVPSTGEMATFGRMARNGSMMAFDEWNNRGGIRGQRLEWTVYDTDCNFESGRQAAQKAVAAGHRFIVGPLCSGAAIGAATVAESSGVLLISPAAPHPLVTVDGQGYTRPMVFRACYVSSWQAKAMARFAAETLKAKKAALLSNPGDDYSAALADTFSLQFAAQGGQIVYQGNFSPGDSDLADTLTAIHQAGAEVIYLPANPATVNRVTAALKRLELLSPTQPGLTLLGSDSWESPQLDLAATTGSYFTTHFALSDDRPLAQTWLKTYKATYAVEPNTLAVLGYDAANLLAAAMTQAGFFEPGAVAKVLEQGQFDGVTGSINFDTQHNPLKPVPLVYIDHDRIIFLTSILP